MSLQSSLSEIKQLFKLHLIVALILIVASVFLGGVLAAKSAFLGALVFLIPNYVFAKSIFKHKGASSAKQIVRAFYKGETLKLSLSIVIFGLVFAFFRVTPLVFFAVYIIMQFVMWLAPIAIVNTAKPKL